MIIWIGIWNSVIDVGEVSCIWSIFLIVIYNICVLVFCLGNIIGNILCGFFFNEDVDRDYIG